MYCFVVRVYLFVCLKFVGNANENCCVRKRENQSISEVLTFLQDSIIQM